MNNKGFQLTVQMLVVIILGLVLLTAGTAIFFKAFNKTVELRENVDTKTQAQLNKLLDDGSLIAIPLTNKEASRGDYADFDIAVNNELGDTKYFSIYVTYGGRVPPEGDPFVHITDVADIDNPCTGEREVCGDAWVLMQETGNNRYTFELDNNGREYVPVRIWVPKEGVTKGQYVFNVDVCQGDSESGSLCDDNMDRRYHTRQKLYVKV